MAIEQKIFDLNYKLNFISNIQETDAGRFKEIIEWSGEMMDFTIKERFNKNIQPKRGEIWTCNLGQNVGSEMNKTRPVIVLTNDLLNTVSPISTVVPISHRQEQFDTHYELKNEDFAQKESTISGTVITEQIKSLSKARFGKKIGELTEEALENVQNRVLSSFGIQIGTQKQV